jgi:hypothetical protein
MIFAIPVASRPDAPDVVFVRRSQIPAGLSVTGLTHDSHDDLVPVSLRSIPRPDAATAPGTRYLRIEGRGLARKRPNGSRHNRPVVRLAICVA